MSTYLNWLSGLSEPDLAELLENRPEVLRGTPARDLRALESRLSQPQAITGALMNQPRPALQVLTALLVLGGRASVARCAGLLEPTTVGGDHVAQVRGWLWRLAAHGLAWVDEDDVAHAAPGAAQVLAVPEGLGRPLAAAMVDTAKDRLQPVLRAWGIERQPTKAAAAAALLDAFGDPVRLAAQLERLTPAQRELLAAGDEDVSANLSRHSWFAQRQRAVQAGVEAGVVLPGYYGYDGEVPAEVRIALRGKGVRFDPDEPALPTTDASPEMVERESTAALVQFSEASLTILDHVRDRPVKWVRNGGIGAREVARIAKACKVDVPVVRLVLDCAYAAGLIEWTGPALECGEVAAAWRDLDPGARVTLLLEQWLTIPWSPTQTHDPSAKALAVGDPDRECRRCLDARLVTLAEWIRIDAGRGVDDASLARLVWWVRPLAHPTHRAVVVEEDDYGYGYRRRGPRTRTYPDPFWVPEDDGDPTLGTNADEARALGLVAHGCATPLLRALLTGDRAAAVALADAMLPAAASRASFGSDLTAVVTGPPTGELSALLDLCADRESRGGAVTWRFSTASVRRALDLGVTAAELASRLEAVAANGLPQPLAYLVTDVGRRHGSLRVADARAMVRSEDEGLLAEVAADRKLRKLGLRLLAPTVLASSVGEQDTIDALRAAGYLPMPWAEPADQAPPVKRRAQGSARRAKAADGRAGGFDGRAGGSDSGEPDLVMAELEAPFAVPGGRFAAAPRVAPAQEAATDAAARLAGAVPAPRQEVSDDGLVAELRRANRILSDDEIAILAAAVRGQGEVRIRYRSASGSVTDRVISEIVHAGHLLEAWCHLRDGGRHFLTSEILSVDYP